MTGARAARSAGGAWGAMRAMYVKGWLAGAFAACAFAGWADAALAAENGWEAVVGRTPAKVAVVRKAAVSAAATGWEPVVAEPVKPNPVVKQTAARPRGGAAATRMATGALPGDAGTREPSDTASKTMAAVDPAPAPAPVEPLAPETALARQYCVNIADAAADARFAWQKKTLGEIEQELNKRIATLEERTAEFKRWLARRDEFSQKAQESVVRIYSRMRAEAAASQLAQLDEETAAAVLIKLDPRNASVVMNEMEPAKAARLTAIISGAAKVPAAKTAKTAPEPAPKAAAESAAKKAPDGKKS